MQKEDNIEQTTNLNLAIRFPAFLSQTFTITWETAIVIALAVLTLFSRLLMLGARVMSQRDESR